MAVKRKQFNARGSKCPICKKPYSTVYNIINRYYWKDI